jgi:hypothetical protein
LIETFPWLASFLQVETIEHDKSSTHQLDHGVQGMFAPTVWRPQARTVPGNRHAYARLFPNPRGNCRSSAKHLKSSTADQKKAALNRFPPNCGKESKER